MSPRAPADEAKDEPMRAKRSSLASVRRYPRCASRVSGCRPGRADSSQCARAPASWLGSASTHPVLDRPERVLDRLSSHSHHLRLTIQSQLHRLEHCFMFPARDAPIVARRALRFERTPWTSRGPVLVQSHAVLDGGKALDGPLPCGAEVLIVNGDVNKVLLVEAAVGQAVGG